MSVSLTGWFLGVLVPAFIRLEILTLLFYLFYRHLL